jgi:hypothetical protein
MALLTSRTLAQSTAITPTTLIHIVTTGDTSQNLQGSSYKAELQQLTPIFGGYTYEIGEYVPSEGGVIFHRYKDGGQERYLVVDIDDLNGGVGIEWSNIDNTIIGQTSQSTWDGESNSNAITSQPGANSGGAFLCSGSTNGSKTDWYLPAIDELSLLWQNRFNVNKTLSGNSNYGTIGGATQILNKNYWSSTEIEVTIIFPPTTAGYAWLMNFGTNIANLLFSISKEQLYSVRAIRKFTI